MSFASNIRDELGLLPIKSLCCRRAYLYGLLYGSEIRGDTICATFSVVQQASYDLVSHAVSLIHTLFSREATVVPLTRGAHRYAQVSFTYKQAAKNLLTIAELPKEDAAVETLSEKLGFKCERCSALFLRGLLVSAGTVNDPAKSYHMELKLPSDGRLSPVLILLSENGYEPGITRGKNIVRLFYKSSENIQEVLAHMGATSVVFDFFNAQIERDIRNNENRATNCVTENINRSMRAGGKQTAAIRWLDEQHLLASLPDDLRITARLRTDHPEATLAELAAMHTPAITKSGLHHRLEKIMTFYEKAMKHK